MQREVKKTSYELWVEEKYIEAHPDHFWQMENMWSWAYGEAELPTEEEWSEGK